MPELFDTGEVRDDPRHWDALARRVAENATRSAKHDAFAWLAQSRAGWIAASLVLGVALASIAAHGDGSAARLAEDWGAMLAPSDDVGKAMTTSETPPAISMLLLRNGT